MGLQWVLKERISSPTAPFFIFLVKLKRNKIPGTGSQNTVSVQCPFEGCGRAITPQRCACPSVRRGGRDGLRSRLVPADCPRLHIYK